MTNPEETPVLYVKVKKDRGGQWRFSAIAPNGEPVDQSEGYRDVADCINEARKLFPDVEVREE